jgi:hypothetical protein
MLGAWGIWMFVDISFTAAFTFFGINLGFVRAPGTPELAQRYVSEANEWQHYGPRILAIFILAIVSLVTFILSLLGAIRSDANTRMRVAVAAIVVVPWMLLIGGHRTIIGHGLYRQATRLLPEYQKAATILQRRWPNADEDLPIGDDYWTSSATPTAIHAVSKKAAYSMSAHIYGHIERTDGGVLRFGITGHAYEKIEYHPNGSEPHSYIFTYWGFPARSKLLRSRKLSEGWYLAEYDRSKAVPSEKSQSQAP